MDKQFGISNNDAYDRPHTREHPKLYFATHPLGRNLYTGYKFHIRKPFAILPLHMLYSAQSLQDVLDCPNEGESVGDFSQ